MHKSRKKKYLASAKAILSVVKALLMFLFGRHVFSLSFCYPAHLVSAAISVTESVKMRINTIITFFQ